MEIKIVASYNGVKVVLETREVELQSKLATAMSCYIEAQAAYLNAKQDVEYQVRNACQDVNLGPW